MGIVVYSLIMGNAGFILSTVLGTYRLILPATEGGAGD